MIKSYESDQKHKFELILVQDCTETDKKQLIQDFDLPSTVLEYVDDKDEPARTEVDVEGDYALIPNQFLSFSLIKNFLSF